ncbi:MAG TPA: nuclear transport factor 2 family protein [Solirubrobacteraceae bacterium]|nr:nuclear transport factor 2 family protein [Solirubrobacteraceae bacterium]
MPARTVRGSLPLTGIEISSAALDEEFVREFAAGYAAAWNGYDSSAMAGLVTEDVEWHDPALPAPARGLAEVQAFMETSWRAFPDLRFSQPDPPHISTSGNLVAWAWRMEGTMRGPIEPPGFAPTGRRMTVDGVDLWQLRDGRIAHYRAFYDMTDLARQLGIMPPPGSGAERATVGLQRLQARLQRRGR